MSPNTGPTVSAIMIFLNEERFIHEAIESVLAQTYSDWELLLVDDGSSDASTDIARTYAARYPEKIRYLAHESRANRGMSAARALGIREARGEYIAYLDGDDVWLPHKLAKQVPLLRAHPEAAAVCGPLLLWHSWAGAESNLLPDSVHGGGRYKPHPYANTLVGPPALLTLFLADDEFIPAAVLVKREVLGRVGGPEEIFRGSYEDAVVWVKLCLSEAVFVDDECLYKYRIHPNSWERRTARLGLRNASLLAYVDWVGEYLNQRQMGDAGVRRSLRKAQWRAHHPWLHRLLDRRYQAARLKRGAKTLGRRALPAGMYHWLSLYSLGASQVQASKKHS